MNNPLMFLFSPLEQFADVSNVLFSMTYHENFFFQVVNKALLIPGNIEKNILGSVVLLSVVFYIYKKFMVNNVGINLYINELKFGFPLFFFIIITGPICFFGFQDYFVINNSLDVVYPIKVNLSFVIDELFITFLLGFLFITGIESSIDEDFLLEKEEATFIEDIVSSLFLANLGKNVDDNGALFVQVCLIFGFVLFCNVIGMIPYSDTATSSLLLTFGVSLTIFGSLLYKMISLKGIHYFFNLFLPAGSPLPLMFLLVPLEFFSYLFRVVSISVRLFANMMAGHTLLKVIVGFSGTMFLLGDIFLVVNLFPIAILFALTFLEIGVAVVQAYIFATLLSIYLKDIFYAAH